MSYVGFGYWIISLDFLGKTFSAYYHVSGELSRVKKCTFPSRCPAEGAGHRSSGRRYGPGMFVSVAWQPQSGVLDQNSKQGSPGSFPPRVRSGSCSPLPGEDRVPEELAYGREHLFEECHSPGHRALPVLHSDVPSRFLDNNRSGGRLR